MFFYYKWLVQDFWYNHFAVVFLGSHSRDYSSPIVNTSIQTHGGNSCGSTIVYKHDDSSSSSSTILNLCY